jgi:hypothetical protein
MPRSCGSRMRSLSIYQSDHASVFDRADDQWNRLHRHPLSFCRVRDQRFGAERSRSGPARMRRTDVRTMLSLRAISALAMRAPQPCAVASHRPAQPFAMLACLSQTGARSFPQDLRFELGEYGQAGHRAAGWRRQISTSFSETKPTPRCLSSWSVASKSVTDRPQRSRRAPELCRFSRRRAASMSCSRTFRSTAPELISRTRMATVQPRRAAWSRSARIRIASVC